MKKLFLASLLLAVTSCANYENYYLNDMVVKDDLQSKPTAELAFKNVVYAKVLENDEAIEQFGPKARRFTIVFLQVENISADASFFSFENALISNDESGKIKPKAKLVNFIETKELDFTSKKEYMNPFRKTEMEDNNFDYNLNNKVLADFALQPSQTQKGFLVFEKLTEADELQFTMSSGVSIYTTRVQTVKLDRD
jgi:hypothetical protein